MRNSQIKKRFHISILVAKAIVVIQTRKTYQYTSFLNRILSLIFPIERQVSRREIVALNG